MKNRICRIFSDPVTYWDRVLIRERCIIIASTIVLGGVFISFGEVSFIAGGVGHFSGYRV